MLPSKIASLSGVTTLPTHASATVTIEYSDDVVFFFHPPHLSHHVPAPFPDNSVIIVIFVSVWIQCL